MLLELLCAFGLLATSFGSPHFKKTTQHASTRGLTVRTSSGIVQGFVNKTAPDVRQFLGVPYAKPPVGNLRFAPPEAATASKSIIHATSLPDSCMQQYSNSSTIYTEYEHEFLISGGQSEDCLYVSIWAPSLESIEVSQAPVPVFVYIPGGGFTSGGQNSMYKIPDTWVQRTQSHIVVIMNYRVNVFGFPNAAGLRTQNLGLLDQRMVVEWVQKNIGAFGGDPTRIVLWGQSAGGTSVAMYPYAWTEDPIVAGLIADSGSAGSINGADTAHTNFTSLAGMVGCGGLSSSAEVACVRNVPAQRLEDALSLYGESGKLPALRFTPTPDGVVVFSNYTERLLSGELAQTPLIIGSNANEGAGFVPFTPNGPGNATLFNTTLNVIACPVAGEVKRRNLRADLYPTYRYQYAGNFSNISPLPWFGAYHSSELPLLFGTHYEYGPGKSTQFEFDVSHAMEALWLSFAQDSRAGAKRFDAEDGGLFSWPEFLQGRNDLVVFAADGKTVQLMDAGPRIDDYCSGL